MTQIEKYAQPQYTVPIEAITDIQRIQEEVPETGIHDFEQRLMTAIQTHANRIAKTDVGVKPSLTINDTEQLYRYVNCTDIAAAQLAVCETTGTLAYGKFNGQHASTIVPSVGAFWNIGGESVPEIKHSSRPGSEVSPEKLHATRTALDLLSSDPSLMGTYVYQVVGKKAWDISKIEGNEVRSSSPVYDTLTDRQRLEDGFVLTTPTVSYRMLNALDILETLRSNRVNNAVMVEYEVAKQSLQHLIPKFR